MLGDARRMSSPRHSSSTSYSFVAALAAFVASFLLTARASAQTITVSQEVSLPRFDASGQQIAKRPLHLNPEAINAQDCRDDLRIRFPVEMNGFQPNAKVQMWASTGSDCTLAPNRQPDTGSCWRLRSGDLPLQSAISVDVPVRAILSPTSDQDVCGALDSTVIDVQILMFEAADSYGTAVVSKRVAVTADTIGPEPPGASVSAGNGRARIEIHALNELGNVSALTAYCEKSAAADTCRATALVPGSEPDPNRECGTLVGSGGSTFFTDPLENGANHVVAVAARDQFGNLGPLSSVACATPSPDAETKVQSLDEPTGCSIGATRARPARGVISAACALGAFVTFVGRRRRAERGGGTF